jgi:drug/metabolite transporter (DMT)-like permease
MTDSKQYFLDRIPLLYVFLSGIGFSIQALVIKLLAEKGFHGSLYCVFTRGILQCLLSLVFMYNSEERKNGTAPALFGDTSYIKIILFLRSFVGFGSIAAGYLAIEYIPLGDSTVLVMLSPMIASILGYLILGEPWRLPEFVATVISFTGAIFVARPPFLFGYSEVDHIEPKQFYTGVFIALFASSNAALAFIFVRILGTTAKMPWSWVTFSQSLAQIILAPPTMYFLKVPFFQQQITLEIAGLIFFGAFIGAWSQAAMTIGMQREKSASATAMRMSDVVFGFIWQACFTTDSINILAIIGAVLVTSSIFVVVVFKPNSASTPPSLSSAALSSINYSPLSTNSPGTVARYGDDEDDDNQIEMMSQNDLDISKGIEDTLSPIDLRKEKLKKVGLISYGKVKKASQEIKKSLTEIISNSLTKVSYPEQQQNGESRVNRQTFSQQANSVVHDA